AGARARPAARAGRALREGPFLRARHRGRQPVDRRPPPECADAGRPHAHETDSAQSPRGDDGRRRIRRRRTRRAGDARPTYRVGRPGSRPAARRRGGRARPGRRSGDAGADRSPHPPGVRRRSQPGIRTAPAGRGLRGDRGPGRRH
ncbi:hypothetical protein OY671_010836, partial [Metschnikowia pulcherrima]